MCVHVVKATLHLCHVFHFIWIPLAVLLPCMPFDVDEYPVLAWLFYLTNKDTFEQYYSQASALLGSFLERPRNS